jgi:uncharacterized cupredoxin-like copper-binding protein
MKTRSMLTALGLACLATTIAGAAAAHGEAAHAGQGAATPKPAAKKEQKPWGIAGDARAVSRTVAVSMGDDMRFRPERLSLRQGETVRFVVRNTGQQLHEFVIGTRAELDEHAALMLKFPGMEHDEPWMAHVPPGRSAEIVWTFNRAGDFDFACLIAGHYQAGMVGKLSVAPAKTPQR